uniref:ODF3A protein n=1 Tax=Calidris pygmaea TaxID=425635 RepID=A0A8C3J9N5_9CHAR
MSPVSPHPICQDSGDPWGCDQDEGILGADAIGEMDGPWVGTWRPHRPRGPVLAQFTSPGPKYTVLGTTGNSTSARGTAGCWRWHGTPPCPAPRGAHPSAPSPPGPGAYTLPRLVGPNTAYTTASPCYTMVGKKKRGGFAEDLARTPGPAAFPKVDVDVYKTKHPSYTMASKAGAGGDRTPKPGPADYRVGKVRQPPVPPSGVGESEKVSPLPVPYFFPLTISATFSTAGRPKCFPSDLWQFPSPW